MPWSRNTSWQQGSILRQEDFQAVGLLDSSSYDLALAVSHDCDIASDRMDSEPFVEFIFAQKKDKQDGTYTNGKNPRILHLNYKHQEDNTFLGVLALNKFTVKKSILENIQPDETYKIISSRQVLQSWLAARYRRHALPNSLGYRLSEVFKYIEKEGKKKSDGVLSFRLSYDPINEIPLQETYELWLTIVYMAGSDEYEEMAKNLAEDLKAQFPRLLEKTKDYGKVDLQQCAAVSETEFTFRDMRDTQEYHLEHLSYRTEPPGPIAQ